MKKNFLLLILFAIFVVSFITFLLIFNYLDPYENRIIALVSMLIASFFSFTTLVTLLLYGFKKIYYRGQVFIVHVMTSFRQGVFSSLFVLGSLSLVSIGAPGFISSLLLAIILICIELFIKNLEA